MRLAEVRVLRKHGDLSLGTAPRSGQQRHPALSLELLGDRQPRQINQRREDVDLLDQLPDLEPGTAAEPEQCGPEKVRDT